MESKKEKKDARVAGFLDRLREKSRLTDLAPTTQAEPGQKKKNRRHPDAVRVPWWKYFLRAALYVFSVVAVVACVVIVMVALYLAKETAGDDELLDLNSIKLSYATQLMAKDETGEWVEYERIYGDENRIWVDYSSFTPELIHCIVASEDKRFWDHDGVDIIRTTRAMLDLVMKQMGFSGLSDDTQGGSTITQQLVKNITTEDETDVMRKIREIYRAYQLERRFTKEQILEAYLNTFRLGGKVAGIEAGANYYFGVKTQDLTAAQCAAIICITKYPTAYDPFIHPEVNQEEREDVLWAMYQQSYLSDAEYAAAEAESDEFVFDKPHTTSQREGEVYSYFTDSVVSQVLNDLVKYKGMTSKDASDLFFKGGLRVYLTIDVSIQQVCEDVALNGYRHNNGTVGFDRSSVFTDIPDSELEHDADGNPIYELDEDGNPITQEENKPQAAWVVMNFEGEVLGLAGGLGEKTYSLGHNKAVDAVRQTGSSMKPLGAYSLGIENNRFTYSTGFPDAPVSGGWPINYGNSGGDGKTMTVAEAIARSYNTIAVRALMESGYDATFDYLTKKLGITSLADPEDRSPSALALGGMTWGISPLQMAAAYSVFGNGGTYYEPHFYTSVLTSRNEIVIDKKAEMYKGYAISPETSMIMNRLLAGVTGHGTGTNAPPNRADNPAGLPYVGKSGTTSDEHDFWWIGMNPYYVMAVWEGYETPRHMVTVRPHPTQMFFKDVMGQISRDLPYKDFPTAPGVVRAAYCTDSGGMPGEGCPTATGYYKQGVYPPRCPGHVAPEEEAPPAA